MATSILLVCTVGYNLGMDIKHATAIYAPRYCYGERGTLELASLVKSLPSGDIAVVPEHIQILAGFKFDKLISANFWGNPNKVAETIVKPQIKLFAYSISYNTIEQVKNFGTNEKMKLILNEHFSHEKIGTFDVWHRKIISNVSNGENR